MKHFCILCHYEPVGTCSIKADNILYTRPGFLLPFLSLYISEHLKMQQNKLSFSFEQLKELEVHRQTFRKFKQLTVFTLHFIIIVMCNYSTALPSPMILLQTASFSLYFKIFIFYNILYYIYKNISHCSFSNDISNIKTSLIYFLTSSVHSGFPNQ